MIPCNDCKHQYENPDKCTYCKSVYWEFGRVVEYEPKTEPPISFYVVEHEGQHNPITKSFESIKEAENYFDKNIESSPVLYEVQPIMWADKNRNKYEKYN